jgi:antitoxin MazE
MDIKLQKWGNSIAMRIPKSILDEASVGIGTEVNVTVEKGSIIIIKPRRSLDRLGRIVERIEEAKLPLIIVEEISGEIEDIAQRYIDEYKNPTMILFKTSGKTLGNVLKDRKHAFVNPPKHWSKGTMVLISKNKIDCEPDEKQISHIAKIKNIRKPKRGEIEKSWPGAKNHWNYIVELEEVKPLAKSFNLEDALKDKARFYGPAVSFKKIDGNHIKLIQPFLN